MRMRVCYLDSHEARLCCYLVIQKTYYAHYRCFTSTCDLVTHSPSYFPVLNLTTTPQRLCGSGDTALSSSTLGGAEWSASGLGRFTIKETATSTQMAGQLNWSRALTLPRIQPRSPKGRSLITTMSHPGLCLVKTETVVNNPRSFSNDAITSNIMPERFAIRTILTTTVPTSLNEHFRVIK
jgi:hypothetical protein